MIGWNAQEVIKKRYSRKDEDGQPIEDWSAISHRIAQAMAGNNKDKKVIYYKMINDRVFIPNTPCIVNAGKPNGQLAACFVLDVPDSIDGIFDAVRKGAMIHKTGGGTGYSFDKLRPAGAPLAAGGVSSGPVSFMKVFNEATNAVKQGGVRRGANMAVLRCLAGSTRIHTLDGLKPIADLVGERPYVYACDPVNNKVHIVQADLVFVSDKNREIVRVYFDNDFYIDCTPDHLFMLKDGSFSKAENLQIGQSLMAFHRQITKSGNYKRYHYTIGCTNGRSEFEHRLVARDILRREINFDFNVHHKDGDTLNNLPENLEVLSRADHASEHVINLRLHQARIASERRGHTLSEIYDDKVVKPWKEKMSKAKLSNHKVVSIKRMGVVDKVYDIALPYLHNFAAEGVFVHNCDHPSILDFIHMKNDQTTMTNFNISVTVTDEFMEAVKNKEWYWTEWNHVFWHEDIIDPLTNKPYRVTHYRGDDGKRYALNQTKNLSGMLYAPDVWNRIVESAWKYAEPGIIFIDEVNRHNLLRPVYGDILTCNPCGEQFLHSNNACNLGSIDLSKVVSYDDLTKATVTAVDFLNDVIDRGHWPLPEIDQMVKKTRPIGLGIMGFADYLLEIQVDYRSEEARKIGARIMRQINDQAWRRSEDIAANDGVFPALSDHPSIQKNYQEKGMVANYQVTTIAPTGTISLIAECSSGIEPNFSWAYYRRDSLGERYYVHPLAAKQLGVQYDASDPEDIKRAAQEVERRVGELPSYFVTADQISAEDHVRMLAAFQPYVDNSISKTCNGAATDTVEDVDKLYRLAHELKVKCVSYYRDGSREGQVLTKLEKKDENLDPELDKEAVSKAASMDFSSYYGVLPLPDGSNKITFPDKIAYPIEVSDSPKNKSILDYLPKQRPSRLEGVTHKIHMNGENLYVTINKSNGAIIEIFTIGNMISESVGRLLSTMLRKGISIEEIIKLLQKTQGQYTVYLAERCCTSPEQVIARLLDMELEESQEKKPPSIPEYIEKVKTEMKAMTGAFDPPIDKPNSVKPNRISDTRDVGLCLECSRILIRKNGCWECICGYSKCG